MRRFAVGRMPADPTGVDRPLLPVEVHGTSDVKVVCLIDTGTAATRFPEWVAIRAGIDLDGLEGTPLGIGGTVVTACPTNVAFTTPAGPLIATVWFCRGWNPPFGLLGQAGFLDRYRLTLDIHEGWFALQPSRSA